MIIVIIIIVILLLASCSHQRLLMVFHFAKSPYVSRTFLSILTDYNNAIV